MAEGTSTGHDDFLSRELEESQTEASIKAETLAALERAEEIKNRLGDSPEVRQEYEDVRAATIGALRNLRISTSENLDEVRRSLTGDVDFDSLSDGYISLDESQHIQRELNELEQSVISTTQTPLETPDIPSFLSSGASSIFGGVNTPLQSPIPPQSTPESPTEISPEEERAIIITNFQETLENTNTLYRYGFLTSMFNMDINNNFSNSYIQEVSLSLQENGEFTYETLTSLRDMAVGNMFDNVEFEIGSQLQRDIAQGFENGNIGEVIQHASENFGQDDTIAVFGSYLEANITSYRDFVFGTEIKDIFGTCAPHLMMLVNFLRETYLENQNIELRNNLENYFINAGVSQERLGEISEEFDTLVNSLRSGGCNIEYIAKIREFNETHFPGQDMTLTEEHARSIIGSTIEIRRSENEIVLANLRDELEGITSKSHEEIQNIFNIEDPEERQIQIELLLREIENDQQRIRLGEILEDAFGMQLEISGQQSRFEEVITNAETIYEMTDAERTEYRRLLMSFTGASINIDISREVHRMYILENPKERVSLLSNAEDLLVVLPEIETGTIDIQDIKSQFLLHPDVLRYFSRGDFRENDFKYLPPDVFNNIELCSILGEDKPHNWDVLFYNIVMAQGVDESTNFLHQLIFTNPGVFRNEDDRVQLEEAIPKTVRDADDENLLVEIGIYEPEINTPTGFNEQVQRYLDYYNSEAYTQEEAVDTGEGVERLSISWANNLNEYIRNYGVSPEIYSSIRALTEAGRNNDIPLLLTSLNPSIEEELGIILQAVEIYDVNYHFLSFQAKRNPQVLRKIGESGNFEDLGVEQYIQDEKGLANYLIGYSLSSRNIGDFIYSQEIETIRLNLNNNESSGDIELTQEEIDALNGFSASMRERGQEDDFLQTLSNVEVEENQIETLRQSIRDYLREYISEEEINVVLECLEARDTDNFWLNLRGYLIEAGVSDEDRRNILQHVSNLVVRVREEERRVAGEEARDTSLLTPEEIVQLEDSPYFENGRFNEEAILRDFQTFAQENLDIEDISQIGNIAFIESYLSSLNLPESVLDKKRENFVNLIQAQSALITANFINGLSPEERDRLIPQRIGSYAGREIGQRILSGEMSFSSPIGNSSSTQGQGIQTGQATTGTTGNQSFVHERLSTSGEHIYFTSLEGDRIPLTAEEAQMLENNPEAEENLVNAYNYFQNIGISSVWKYRVDLIKAMNIIGGDMAIDLTDDSLNSEELLKVAKYIYQITHGQQGNESQVRGLDFYERELEIYANGGSELIEKRAHDGLQRDRFEHDLWENGVLSANINGFDTERLREIARSPEGLSGDTE